jgi:hypothetical protein
LIQTHAKSLRIHRSASAVLPVTWTSSVTVQNLAVGGGTGTSRSRTAQYRLAEVMSMATDTDMDTDMMATTTADMMATTDAATKIIVLKIVAVLCRAARKGG